MTDLPWDQVIDCFLNLIIGLVPVAVTISVGVFVWRFWLKVTGLR